MIPRARRVDGSVKLEPQTLRGFHKEGAQNGNEADVTEGSGGVWEREHYDWSDPNRVVVKTTDSNTWGGDSGHAYTFTRNDDGTTDIDHVVVREGKNLKGRFFGLVLGSVGKGRPDTAFANSVKAIEARHNGASGSPRTPAS